MMNEVALRKIIGTNLQKARKAKRLTQKDVAQRVGLTANYYATLEQGVTIGSIETIYKIIDVLETKATDIFPDNY